MIIIVKFIGIIIGVMIFLVLCTVDQNSWNEGTSNQHTIKNAFKLSVLFPLYIL